MTRRFSILLFGSALLALHACDEQSSAHLSYFDQAPPASTPKIFAPGLISLPGRWEGNAVFSSDGQHFYFNVFEGDKKAIYRVTRTEDGWSEPAPFEELGIENNWEPFISADGRSFYFVSSRPPGSPEWNGRIWRSDKTDQQWSLPVLVDLGHDTETGYWFPNLSSSGDLYFGGMFPAIGNYGKGDGYFRDSETGTIRNIDAINTEHEEWDPYIAPDESFIMWASDRPGGFGGTDLYISFRNPSVDEAKKGEWGNAINMGPLINTPDYEVAPRLSPDGKYLFFDRPIDGTQDIFWVSMDRVLALNEPNVHGAGQTSTPGSRINRLFLLK